MPKTGCPGHSWMAIGTHLPRGTASAFKASSGLLLALRAGVVFFPSQHRRLRLVVHPFCFCPRWSSFSMIRRTSSATEIAFPLAIFSSAAFCGFEK